MVVSNVVKQISRPDLGGKPFKFRWSKYTVPASFEDTDGSVPRWGHVIFIPGRQMWNNSNRPLYPVRGYVFLITWLTTKQDELISNFSKTFKMILV